MKVRINSITFINISVILVLTVLCYILMDSSATNNLKIFSAVALALSILATVMSYREMKQEITLVNQLSTEDKIFKKFNVLLDEYAAYTHKSTKSIDAHAAKSLGSVRASVFTSIDRMSSETNHISSLRSLDPKSLNDEIDKIMVEMLELNKVMLDSIEDLQKEDLISQYILQINLANEKFNSVCKELVTTLVDFHNSENIESFDLSHIEAQIDRCTLKIEKFNKFLDECDTKSTNDLDLF